MKVLTVFGTRPEAIKMAPVIKALKKHAIIESKVCVTAQHRLMLDQVLDLFKITPDFDLNLMQPDQTLTDLSTNVLLHMRHILQSFKPHYVLVQGDTTTAAMVALAAFYEKIFVGHIEAGLRTHQLYSPWPEEANRRIISVLAHFHFAPTQHAAHNLYEENVPVEKVLVTGNTVIDSLLYACEQLEKNSLLKSKMTSLFSYLHPHKRLILVTGHRRESFGEGFKNICQALALLSNRSDIQIVYPVHLNQNVQKPVKEILGGKKNVFLIDPLDYLPFVYLMQQCDLILTDSGGIQEEAPSLGKPVLIMRNITERPETLKSGGAKLIGTRPETILSVTQELLDNEASYQKMSYSYNPYGDGHAAEKIVNKLLEYQSDITKLPNQPQDNIISLEEEAEKLKKTIEKV